MLCEKKMKTYSETYFLSPKDSIFLTVTEKKYLLSETIVSQTQLTFICSNSAILTVKQSMKYVQS